MVKLIKKIKGVWQINPNLFKSNKDSERGYIETEEATQNRDRIIKKIAG
jgi:hypothetical protein